MPRSAVTGEIVLPTDLSEPSAVDVYVRVEDVSLADGVAELVGEMRLVRVALPRGDGATLAFEIEDVDWTERSDYSVRVHIDFDRSGEVSSGDLISTQAHPVLSHGHPTHVRVPVRRV